MPLRFRGGEYNEYKKTAPQRAVILGSMQRQAIMTKIVWATCIWAFVSACAVAWASSARADHASFSRMPRSPFDGVLRFLAPEPTSERAPRHHKMRRAARAGKTAKFAAIRVAPARTHPAQRAPVLTQAGLHAVRRVPVHVAAAPSYLHSPYPPVFVPRYPGPPFAYAGPPAFPGYASRYSPYTYAYGYQYPYYVYYIVPWPRWPAGY